MSVLDLKLEIERVEREVEEVESGPVYCPPSKGISSDVGHLMGLKLRALVMRDALGFVEKGPPTGGGKRSIDSVTITVSREGARSFLSDSAGWGAMGLQEVDEALWEALGRPERSELRPEAAP